MCEEKSHFLTPIPADYPIYLEKCAEIPSDLATAFSAGYRALFHGDCFFAHDMYWQTLRESDKTYFLPPCGDWQSADWKEIFRAFPAGTRFEFIPESLLALWTGLFPGRLEISTDKGDWDYIYDIGRLTGLSSMRRLRRKFVEAYSPSFESIHEQNYAALLRFNLQATDEICRTHTDNFRLMEEDNQVLSLLLESGQHFPSLEGVILKADGICVSYLLWERLNDTSYVALFNKTLHQYKGATETCVLEMCRRISARGGRYLNYTCDAGIPGLRQAKSLRKPITMLKKYTVILH